MAAGAPLRRAPYKDFLQPALQSRFAWTGMVLLGVAYLEALLLASWDSLLWAWFPIGPAGIRTLILFSGGLAILILRIAHYHVGLRTTGPGWQVIATSLSAFSTYETAFWYGVSSSLFTFVYLQSTSAASHMSWIVYMHGDRAKLNERPIFLSCYMLSLALQQTVRHYLIDIDHLPLAGLPSKHDQLPQIQDAANPANAMLLRVPRILLGVVLRALLNFGFTIVLYNLAIRRFAWSWALLFFRPFYTLPKSNLVPPGPELQVYAPAMNLFAGLLLGFLWEVGNLAFTIYMSKAPIKNGKPLTSDAKDPNGSLLNGLKAKKPSIKVKTPSKPKYNIPKETNIGVYQSFALWELANIAAGVDARRQAIYQDIDRKDGPMWSQVYGICMEAVKSIETRIDDFNKPPASAAPVPLDTSKGGQKRAEERRSTSAPPKEDDVFTSSKESVLRQELKKYVRGVVTSPGSPPTNIRPWVEKTLQESQSRRQKDAKSDVTKATKPFQQLILSGIEYQVVSALFQQDFRTRFAGVVLGSPYAEPTIYAHAIVALCELASHSLSEDQFGNVHRDVPSIVRALTSVIVKVQLLKEAFPKHWTDTSQTKTCPEVDMILQAAKTGLQGVVDKFEPYHRDLKLTLTDLRLAREAAASSTQGTEMEQVR